MKTPDQLLSILESKIPHYELINSDISKASVGWHIEHSLLALNSIIDALNKSHPEDYKRSLDLRRSAVMLLEKFPRGRIKSPKAVQPATGFNFDTLNQHVSISRE